MTPKNLTRFFDALHNNDEFRREFVQLAAHHGVDFTEEDDQISDQELDAVAGGMTQLDQMELQRLMQQQAQAMQTMSNISRMLHDTSKSIIKNLRA